MLLGSRTDNGAFLASQPLSSLTPLALAVFMLFCSMGFVTDVVHGGRQPLRMLAANVLFSGTIALGYGLSSLLLIRHRAGRSASGPAGYAGWGLLAFGATAALHFFIGSRLADWFGPLDNVSPAYAASRLRVDAMAISFCVASSYALFLMFIGRTGHKLMTARAELRLAAEIHEVLVPPIATRIGDFEFYAFSKASGDVGGDLVDVVAEADASPGGGPGGSWLAYVADVSGHGVSSGLVMGMTKSAVHMRLRTDTSLAALLNDLNLVLFPLKRPSMYVTFAGVAYRGGNSLEFAVAGHLPIVRVTRGTVIEHTTPQIPLGFFEETRFESSRLTCEPGDLLAILTDGLTDVFDRNDREFGLARIEAYLRACADRPLAEIASGLMAQVQQHGPQTDDQTLLLIRRYR